ncbi:MAG: 2'-deoxycytidine 5'-triphosphate deaminase [Acidimicrobiales bacterium]
MRPLEIPAGAAGVLANQHLSAAVASGVIDAGASVIPEPSIQPASIDLRLGEVAYRLRSSFLPGRQSVEAKVAEYVIDELDLRGRGAVLETNRPYLIPLRERVRLPAGMRAKANPKSSTGRLDVFTRVVTDYSYRFDEIAEGYQGSLYLEVVPLSFAIRLRQDITLCQLRLAVGRTGLDDLELREFHEVQPLLFKRGRPVVADDLFVAGGLLLGLDLSGDEQGRVGYRSRDFAPLLDLTTGEKLDRWAYWEPVTREEGGRIVLTPQRFYLLMSEEAVVVPPNLAAEMTAYDPTSGELRTHYAGFFDPAFGYDPAGSFHGSRAALEVRAHEVPFTIEHGQRVCKLTFEHMLEEPTALYGEGIGSSYQCQEDALGKHFSLPDNLRRGDIE